MNSPKHFPRALAQGRVVLQAQDPNSILGDLQRARQQSRDDKK
jgi:hypothetical protein